MKDLSFTQSFSLIALNGQNSLYMTVPKKVGLRCMAAAAILECYLDNSFKKADDKLAIDNSILNDANVKDYDNIILKDLVNKSSGAKRELKWWLKKASMSSNSKLTRLEHIIADSLKKMNLIEDIPGLLGCDLYYVTSGVKVKEYRSNIEEYTGITESVRAEILEEGPITDEVICMIWLLRESGCMHDLFSRNEIQKVAVKMNELIKNNELAKALFQIHIYKGIEMTVKEFLRLKKSVMTTSFGSGVNFTFPILERSQSVFIDTEEWFENSPRRLEDLKTRLLSNGHEIEVQNEGKIPVIKIDNIVYEAVPQAVKVSNVPVHGVRLLPVR